MALVTEHGLTYRRHNKVREVRCFWDWFEAQRKRKDEVGWLAREIIKAPERRERRFTAHSLYEFIRDELGGDDDWQAARTKAAEEFACWLDIDQRLWVALQGFAAYMKREKQTLAGVQKRWAIIAAIIEEKAARG